MCKSVISLSSQLLANLKSALLIFLVLPLVFSGLVSADNNKIAAAEIDQTMTEQTSNEQGAKESSGAVASETMRLALLQARESGRDVMVVFGADWCDRCALLKRYMDESALQDRIQSQFIVLLVDVGYGDKNQRYEAQMGHPTREGLPAVVIADSSDQFTSIMTSEELVTFLPDRDQPIYDWMDRVLKYAEQTYAVR
jgi:thiol:disulfide interchange protein